MKIKVLFFFVLPLSHLFGQSLDTGIISQIEEMIRNKMEKEQIPGLSIAIVLEDSLIWSEGFGYADLENKVKARPETAYRSASIGKPITATAAMQLYEKGKLDLKAPIQNYCPEFPEKPSPVNSRHLLAHLSGIRHYGGPRHRQELISKVHYKNIIEPLSIFKDDSLLFEPGSRYQYSTYGYNVLGCVVQGASGQTFGEYVKKHIFQAAGMPHTQVDDPYRIIPRRASGYRISDESGQLENCEWVDMSNKIPAGGFLTTAPDLARFARAFMNEELVRATTREAMLEPQKTSTGDTIAYGLGWGLFPGEKWYGEREAFHGGGTPGVSGVLYMLPDRRFAVAILMNLEGDFNFYRGDENDEPAIQLLKEKGYRDVFNPFKYVYREEDYNVYSQYMKDDYTGEKDMDIDENLHRYFLHPWRKNQISDHYPIWAEIIIDSSDPFLKEKLEILKEESD